MNNEDAIKQINSLIENSKSFHEEDGDIWERDIEALNVAKHALALINRQQAEIERLKDLLKRNKRNANRIRMITAETAKRIKSEAVKEFAEKSENALFIRQDEEREEMLRILKTYRGTRAYSDTEVATDNWLRGYGEAVQDILSINDDLAKEMVGD